MSIYSGPEIVNDGLVLHLDAANPRSYPGTGTTWFDLSPAGNNGTLVSGTSFTSSNNGAFVFDGMDNGVEITSPQVYGGSFTLIVWFNSIDDSRGILFGNYDTDIDINFEKHDNRRLRFYWNTGQLDYSTPVSTIKTGVDIWNQAVFLRDTTNTKVKMYYNGSEVFTSDIIGTNIGAASTAFMIGRDSRTGATVLNGHISFLALYNRALSEEEIKQNFEALRGRYGI